MHHLRSTATTLLGILALVVAAVLAAATPAAARVTDRGEIHDTFTDTITDFCGAGLTVDLVATVDGRFQANSRGPDAFDYFLEKTTVVRVFTLTGTDKTATDIQPNTLNKDLSIVDNGDTVTVIALLTGGQRTYGTSGKLIARNSGQVRFKIVFDAETGEELSNELIFGSTGTNDDFCAAVLADWGRS